MEFQQKLPRCEAQRLGSIKDVDAVLAIAGKFLPVTGWQVGTGTGLQLRIISKESETIVGAGDYLVLMREQYGTSMTVMSQDEFENKYEPVPKPPEQNRHIHGLDLLIGQVQEQRRQQDIDKGRPQFKPLHDFICAKQGQS